MTTHPHPTPWSLISIERMHPHTGDLPLSIRYGFYDSLFGNILIASTDRGICYMAFTNAGSQNIDLLKARFPHATILPEEKPVHRQALQLFFDDTPYGGEQIPLHLKGTDFQHQVWEQLLTIPRGSLSSYGALAQAIDRPNASRAIGAAVGANPVALLVPCHRIIRTTGELGGYRWGLLRKAAIIEWERSR